MTHINSQPIPPVEKRKPARVNDFETGAHEI
jgi:hypothetical protein